MDNCKVGAGVPDAGNNFYALLWRGTAASAVELNPSNLSNVVGSTAVGVSPDGTQQVGGDDVREGEAEFGHAMLWSGAADTAVDLHPSQIAGIDQSLANAMNGVEQVGYGSLSSNGRIHRALVWTGTAESAVDLQALLPSGFVSSTANSVDAAGDVFGTALDAAGNYHAIEWMPVPESSFGPVVWAATLILYRRGTRK